MPSIPQSLLWISLVVLWLFVLVPMLINRRDTVRRTSDVALATRVLNSGGRAARLIRRGKPAAGHRTDPEWRPEDELEDYDEDETGPVVVTGKPLRGRAVVVVTSVAEEVESEYLDVDVVDMDSGALPVAKVVRPEKVSTPDPEQAEELPLEFEQPAAAQDEPVAEHDAEPVAEADDSEAAMADDEYEYIDDTSGLEAEADPPTTATPAASRTRRYESKTAAAVSARKYQFRKRTLMTMAVLLLASGAAAYLWSTTMWYLCATIGAITLLYLAYLRRQTRIEERLRRRRMQRMARSRLGVENTVDHELNVVPARLRRPGAAVLEIDDEDPVFEHLEYVPFAREYDLPKAAGQ
ncbi:divisome protein SepX/GlpR [Mycolicibacterium mengxianglii]|uniref:divisome protein SepX/GlpR n=1 Tax=Mycolicibacterium mengxianglii TaxID=2736649 RepID=UPI0018EF22D3|nr:gephyrin-like molybdotransferase receptor GlpR [Mycolicibacterium mengxianglii]